MYIKHRSGKSIFVGVELCGVDLRVLTCVVLFPPKVYAWC